MIVGLLLQPLLSLVWGRALLGLLNAHLNSPERTHRPILVSLLSGSEILGGDTLGKDLALSEGCASCMCWSGAQQRGLFGGKGLSLNVEILLIFQSENETCPKVRSKPSSKEALPGILLLPLLAPSAATIWATNRAE